MQQELSQLTKFFGRSSKTQIFLILLTSLILYLNILPNELVWDDKTFINWNLIKTFKSVPLYFRGILPDTHVGDYRPIKGLILSFDYHIWGNNLIGYRFQAIFIHLATIFLVYILGLRLLRDKWVAFMAASLFALHPVQVEAIAFLTSSGDMLGVAATLAAFYAFIKSLEPPSRRRLCLLLSLALWVIAILTYETSLVLPLLIAVYLYCFKRKRIRLKQLAAVELPYALIAIIYVLVRIGFLGLHSNESYLMNSFGVNLIVMVKVVFNYIRLLIFPLHLSVNQAIFPDIPANKDVDLVVKTTPLQLLLNPSTVLAIAIIIGLGVIALKSYKKNPLITFCIAWWAISLLPVLNLVPISQLMAERYLYLPSVGYVILLALLMRKLYSGRYKRIINLFGAMAFLVIIIFYFLRTFIRIRDWQDSVTLWTKELEYSSRSTLARHNLGVGYFEKGDMMNALKQFQLADSNNPHQLAKIPYNLGLAYFELKDLVKAEDAFKKSLDFDKNNSAPYFQLGKLYKKSGLNQRAIEYYANAINSDPYDYQSHVEIASLYAWSGHDSEAISEYETALTLNPLMMPAYYDIAALYIRLNRVDLANAKIKAGLRIDPGNELLQKALKSIESPLKNRR